MAAQRKNVSAKSTPSKLTAVDLFCGCGGLSLGLKRGGIDVLKAFDSWDVAVECYRENFDHEIEQADLSDPSSVANNISGIEPDLIAGGPPCQDFSHAGKRSEGDRANLTESFAEIVCSVRPKFFIMENVDRAKSSLAFASARKMFLDAGYGLTERVLDASYCGVPQRRKRFFCIGGLGEASGFLEALLEAKLSNSAMTVRDYFGDELEIDCYYRHPRNYSRRGIFSVDEPAPTMRGVNRPVPAGYPGHPGDPCQVTDKLRPLTTLERARIQTFPKSFKWSGTKTAQEQMIGNAVPVDLAKYVAKSLIAYVNSKTNNSEQELWQDQSTKLASIRG